MDKTLENPNPNLLLNQHCRISAPNPDLTSDIMDMVQRGDVKLQYVATDEQIADVLMKPLVRLKFEYFREKLGVLIRGNFNLKLASQK